MRALGKEQTKLYGILQGGGFIFCVAGVMHTRLFDDEQIWPVLRFFVLANDGSRVRVESRTVLSLARRGLLTITEEQMPEASLLHGEGKLEMEIRAR